MAKQQQADWIQKIVAGADRPDYTAQNLGVSRWAHFWNIIKAKTGVMFFINFLAFIFCLPAIACMVLQINFNALLGAAAPFTAYVGPTSYYPSNVTAQELYNALVLQNDLMFFALLIAGIAIACIGLAGAFNAVKLLSKGENIKIFRAFFGGIKKNALQFVLAGVLTGSALFLLVLNIDSLALKGGGLLVFSLIAAIILIIIALFVTFFVFTQTASFKIKIWPIIRNSLLFSVGTALQNILFIGLTIAPVLLVFVLNYTLGLFVVMLYAFIGVSATVLIWLLYSSWVFDRYLAVSVRTDGKIISQKTASEKKNPAQSNKPQQQQRYINPKKGKK